MELLQRSEFKALKIAKRHFYTVCQILRDFPFCFSKEEKLEKFGSNAHSSDNGENFLFSLWLDEWQ